MKIIIAGLGVMGGSIAKSLAFSKKHEILAVERDGKAVCAAAEAGVIKGEAKDEDLSTADVIFLCLYPENVVEFLSEKVSLIKPGTLVTDICGIKREIYPVLKSIADKNGFDYVGSHPMAGKEKSSYFASDSGLFLGASYIIVTEGERSPVLEDLALEMGFKGTRYVTSEEHDAMIAFTSQLPHVISCAYVKSPCCLKHEGFSAGSFRDMSRVANINAELWTELFLMNKQALLDEIEVFKSSISLLEGAIRQGDGDELNKLLEESRKIKTSC